jgi:hypothetical protein
MNGDHVVVSVVRDNGAFEESQQRASVVVLKSVVAGEFVGDIAHESICRLKGWSPETRVLIAHLSW